MFDGR